MTIQQRLYTMLLGLLCLLPCGGFAMNFTLESPAFGNKTTIPKQYTCDGADQHPTLTWNDPPVGTQSLVLVVDDLDAPHGTWVHWLVFNIPVTVRQLPEGQSLPHEALVGLNSWDKKEYGGPCPPSGLHRYMFKLYALDVPLTVNSSVHYSDIENAMQTHILAQTTLIGLYSH